VKSPDILQSIMWLYKSWEQVSVVTIKNCFQHSQIYFQLNEIRSNNIAFEKFIREFPLYADTREFGFKGQIYPVRKIPLQSDLSVLILLVRNNRSCSMNLDSYILLQIITT